MERTDRIDPVSHRREFFRGEADPVFRTGVFARQIDRRITCFRAQFAGDQFESDLFSAGGDQFKSGYVLFQRELKGCGQFLGRSVRSGIEHRQQIIFRIECGTVDTLKETAEQAAFQSVRQIVETCEPVQIVDMDARGAAPADGVVRMILQQQFPCVAQRLRFIETPVTGGECEHNAQRLQFPFELCLCADVCRFKRDPRGEGAGQQERKVAAAHFHGEDGEAVRLGFDAVDKGAEC